LAENLRAPLWQWSAVDIASAVAARRISCVDAVASVVERLRAANGPVNAVTVDLGDAALTEAAAADARLARGEPPRALEGVAVTTKENVDQEGQATPNGLPALAGNIAREDAPVVSNLRAAGALIVGRTNTPEFSLRYFTDNPLRGRTENPWDLALTCGGSSGGAAVATALGIGAIAHGNDLGGSLRYPAYCCGVAALRPSFGRVPTFNPSNSSERPPLFQLMSVQGPIAREVRDLRLALAAMARRDVRDPWWVPAPLAGDALERPIRVALCEASAYGERDAAVSAALAAAAAALESAGYRVERCEPPGLAEIAELRASLLAADIEQQLGSTMRRLGSAKIQWLIHQRVERARALDLKSYQEALSARAAELRRWLVFLEDYPLVLAPVSLRTPFAVDEDLKSAEHLAEVLRAQAMLSTVNFLGLPALAVATGIAGGAPCGVQLISRPFREDLCLAAGEAIEARAGSLARRLWPS
jgi:amidase